jgi:hypothetical protein
MSVFLLMALAVFVWLVVRALRTRDADAPRESLETTRVCPSTPGMHDIDSEAALRARGEIPRR